MEHGAWGITLRIADLIIFRGVSWQGCRKIQDLEFRIQEEKS
jgi:hypothetical protein